ncbi:hypothetical protein IJ182_01575, partial [bacterium]|nr:hypothetical protein [bacterium]
MKISNLSPNVQYTIAKKTPSKNNNINIQNEQVSFGSKKDALRKASLASAALFAAVPAVNTANIAYADTQVPAIVEQMQASTPANMAEYIDAMREVNALGLIMPNDISYMTMPITEFYFVTGHDGEVTLHPNDSLERNEQGTIVVTVTQTQSDSEDEGATLGEIVNKVYSDALDGYEGEQRTAIFNKLIDEVIQANPGLAEFVEDELGADADSYERVANLNLHTGKTGKDESMDSRFLTMPTTVVYQVQNQDYDGSEFIHSSRRYTPNNQWASVIKDSDDLLDGEYASFSDMIYAEYGDDLSDEAYRDIVYSVVNLPQNRRGFEQVLDDMNFNVMLTIGNIDDLNRMLDENTEKTLPGIFLPEVTTLRTQDSRAVVNPDSGDRLAPVYQISPAYVVEGQDDREILIVSRTSDSMKPGDVYTLQDVLQFYSSPDGNGRFANVENGHLELNQDVGYVDEFARNILEQVVYANLDIFTAPYEDDNGYNFYGVFDVAPGYDTEGKSLEDIVMHSTINYDRMMNYSFVGNDGASKFEDGVELRLPQFNYRINESQKMKPCIQQPVTTPVPTQEPTPVPTQEPTPVPTEEPTPVPTEEPTPVPTQEPTPVPTEEPTPVPTEEPTPVPTEEPTPVPTQEPTPVPTEEPTPVPTCEPTPEPEEPSEEPEPSLDPTPVPTAEPTPVPTCEPTPEPEEPSEEPEPSLEPTPVPTAEPTPVPTEEPTPVPTEEPTPVPTDEPTLPPQPTATDIPPVIPTVEPTPTPGCDETPEPEQPSEEPEPSIGPEPFPTPSPTAVPSPIPTDKPTPEPEVSVEPQPTAEEVDVVVPGKPTPEPTETPTEKPTEKPTQAPTEKPTQAPTEKPECEEPSDTDKPKEEDEPTIDEPKPQEEKPTEKPADPTPKPAEPTKKPAEPDEKPAEQEPSCDSPSDGDTHQDEQAPSLDGGSQKVEEHHDEPKVEEHHDETKAEEHHDEPKTEESHEDKDTSCDSPSSKDTHKEEAAPSISSDAPKEEKQADAPKEEKQADAPKEEKKSEAPKEEKKSEAPKEEKQADAPKEEKQADAPKE